MQNTFNLLVAFDGSAFSDAAIDELAVAGLPAVGVHARIVSIAEAWELPDLAGLGPSKSGRIGAERAELLRSHLNDLMDRTAEMASGAADRVRSRFPDWTVESEGLTGKPTVELIRIADEWQPELIVIGSHGRGFIGRAILGSVSLKVLHEARSSVRIVRKRPEREDSAPRILVALDGSECSDLVVETVIGRTWPADTQFLLVTADDDPGNRPEISSLDAVREGHKDSPEAKAWLERVLQGPMQKFEKAGLSAEQVCRWASASSLILDQAEEWKADCIFIGARGVGRVSRMVLGSVSAAVAARAKCTVEVVRDLAVH